jgi:Mu transposase, C-terminal
MRRGIDQHGPPDSVKIDNGKDYDSQLFTGTTKQKRRILKAGYLDEQLVVGLYAMMDIGVSFSIPYHPQSKAIEPWFNTMDVQFIKTIETYTGKDTARKPEDLAAKLNDPKVIARAFTLDTFAEAVGDYINIYNNSAHTGKGMNGRAPADVMATRASRRVISDGVLELLMRVWSGELKISKNGVKFKYMNYGQYDPELHVRQGAKCRASYDPDDIRRIYIYDLRTCKLITIAEQNQLIGYGAAVSEEALRDASKQKARALKLTKSYRDASLTARMDLPTLTRRAMAEAAKADKADRRPAATTPTPTIRPVATPMDNQTAEHIKAAMRKMVKKAAGAEGTTQVLDFDPGKLRGRAKKRTVELFNR